MTFGRASSFSGTHNFGSLALCYSAITGHQKRPRIELRALSPTPDRSYSEGCLVSGSGTITVSSSPLSPLLFPLPATGLSSGTTRYLDQPDVQFSHQAWIASSEIHQRAKCFSLTFASRLRSLPVAKLSKFGKFLLIIRNGLLQKTCVGAPKFYGRAA